MTRYSRSKGKCRPHRPRIQKTKNRKKDVDQIQEEMSKPNKSELVVDEDLPGQGLHPCQACDRHFIDDAALVAHLTSKLHKKRIKELKEEPYSQAEAESAAGLGSYKRIKLS